MYILTLFLLVGSSLSGITAEYDDQKACETAIIRHKMESLNTKFSVRVVSALCTAKNVKDIPEAR